MRRLACAFALVGLLASGASAATITYVANLNGASENPANSSTGSGTATAVLDTVTNSLQLSVTFSGLESTTTAAHIHCCVAPPTNVGVAIGSTGFPTPVTSGSFNATYDLNLLSTYSGAFVAANGGTLAGARAALLAALAAGQAYYNIHTSTYPGGEIRGFFALPEPTLGVLLGGAGLLALRVRRRAARS